MDYRIIRYHSLQFLVKPGDLLTVPGIQGAAGDQLPAETLMLAQSDQYQIGAPTLTEPASLTVQEIKKSPKIRVSTYKAKSRYRKTKGHRQDVTVLKFDPAPAPKAKSKPKAVPKPAKV